MRPVDLGGGVLWVGPSWQCVCQHDACFVRRGEVDHDRSCPCPRDRQWVAVAVTDDAAAGPESDRVYMLRPDRVAAVTDAAVTVLRQAAAAARAA